MSFFSISPANLNNYCYTCGYTYLEGVVMPVIKRANGGDVNPSLALKY